MAIQVSQQRDSSHFTDEKSEVLTEDRLPQYHSNLNILWVVTEPFPAVPAFFPFSPPSVLRSGLTF